MGSRIWATVQDNLWLRFDHGADGGKRQKPQLISALFVKSFLWHIEAVDAIHRKTLCVHVSMKRTLWSVHSPPALSVSTCFSSVATARGITPGSSLVPCMVCVWISCDDWQGMSSRVLYVCIQLEDSHWRFLRQQRKNGKGKTVMRQCECAYLARPCRSVRKDSRVLAINSLGHERCELRR